MSRICHIEIDDSGLPAPTPEIEQERKVAVFDLLEDNTFAIPGRNGAPAPEGPFHLGLAIREGRLVFDTSRPSSAFRPRRSKRSTWRGGASTTKAPASSRNAWTARPISISTRRAGSTP
jgi:hypothetical protein